MSKKKTTKSPIPFQKTIYVQNAQEVGDAGPSDGNWLLSYEQEEHVNHGVRCAVYQLVEVVVIEKTETFTRKKTT